MPAAVRASRVLYVDDEPGLCRAFARLFNDRADVKVSTVGSPDEALDLLARESFDVIVSDLRMPGMSGLELLATARHRAPEARRLLVSGYADFETALDAINEVGIDRLLTKPWQTEEVRGAIDNALRVVRLTQENVRVTDELRRRTEELEQVNQRLDALVEERTSNLLDGLVSALDLRDSETQWHSRRVGRYARRLAHELGLDGRELDDNQTVREAKVTPCETLLLRPGAVKGGA